MEVALLFVVVVVFLLIGVPIIVLGLGLWALAERRATRKRSIELESALLADGTSVPTFRIQN